MVFNVVGIVNWKGKRLANGIDGKYETNDPWKIERLKILGFKEYVEKPKPVKQEVVIPEPTIVSKGYVETQSEEEVQTQKTETVAVPVIRRGRPRK